MNINKVFEELDKSPNSIEIIKVKEILVNNASPCELAAISCVYCGEFICDCDKKNQENIKKILKNEE